MIYSSFKNKLLNSVEKLGGINFVSTQMNTDAATLKNLAFELAKDVDNLFFVAGSEFDGKALLTLYVSKNLVEEKGFNAGSIIRDLGKHIQGGGGGQPFFATAGGKNPQGIAKALDSARKFLD